MTGYMVIVTEYEEVDGETVRAEEADHLVGPFTTWERAVAYLKAHRLSGTVTYVPSGQEPPRERTR